jgi:hypothetical protein
LKENVIIGRLIPARFDLSEEGRQRLGLDELERQRAEELAAAEAEAVGALAGGFRDGEAGAFDRDDLEGLRPL